jgi:hypothetical protein
MVIRRSRWQSVVACAAGVACLTLTAAACSSSSSSSSSSSAPASSSAAATSAPASSAPAASASASSAAGSSSGVPAGLTGDAETVAENWVAFFNAKTPTATRLSLLQNGSKYSAVLAGQASNPQASLTSASVTAVTVSGSTATVTWDLLLSGSPVLTKQKGSAVKVGGVWQVSDASFCGLLSLQPPVPAVCK